MNTSIFQLCKSIIFNQCAEMEKSLLKWDLEYFLLNLIMQIKFIYMWFYQATDSRIECAWKLPWKFIGETITNPMHKL